MENNLPLLSSEFRTELKKYTFFLAEFRRRVLFTLSVFIVATIAGFFLYEKIIKFLIDALSLQGINIVFTSPFQFINLAISCGLTVGLIITVPLIVAEILYFLKPALKKRELSALIWFLPFSLILFIIGFLLGFLTMKWQIGIFLTQSVAIGIGNILDISRLLNVVLITSSLMGLGFQFPLLLLLLMRIGLIKHQSLAKKRKWVYLASFIFALFLPPDSILADIVLSMPLILLFEITLFMNKLLEHSKAGKAFLEN